MKDAVTLLHKVEEATEQNGLHVNERKMEFISYNEQGQVFSRKNKPIKQVDDFPIFRLLVECNSARCRSPHIKGMGRPQKDEHRMEI